jgi:hypothetical protein
MLTSLFEHDCERHMRIVLSRFLNLLIPDTFDENIRQGLLYELYFIYL